MKVAAITFELDEDDVIEVKDFGWFVCLGIGQVDIMFKDVHELNDFKEKLLFALDNPRMIERR